MPIVLHLIMRRKPRHLEFPALRLVQLRHETNRRRLRLRHLLLLALRVAAIAILAMALARPSLKFSGVLGSQEAPVAAVLVFDTAPRMQYRLANRTRLEEAQEMGRWLLRQLPGESRIGVLDTRLGPGAFQVDRGAAADRIDRLASVANSQPLADVLDEAFRLLATSDLERKEIYVFTDLARAAWPADTAARIEQHAAETARREPLPDRRGRPRARGLLARRAAAFGPTALQPQSAGRADRVGSDRSGGPAGGRAVPVGRESPAAKARPSRPDAGGGRLGRDRRSRSAR